MTTIFLLILILAALVLITWKLMEIVYLLMRTNKQTEKTNQLLKDIEYLMRIKQ